VRGLVFFEEERSFFLHLFLIEERASINQGGFGDKVIRVQASQETSD